MAPDFGAHLLHPVWPRATEGAGVMIKRPVRLAAGLDGPCFIGSDDYGAIYTEEDVQEAAACINHAPALAEALRLMVARVYADRPKLDLSEYHKLLSAY